MKPRAATLASLRMSAMMTESSTLIMILLPMPTITLYIPVNFTFPTTGRVFLNGSN